MSLTALETSREAWSRSIMLVAVLVSATASIDAAAIRERHAAKPAIELVVQPLLQNGRYRALEVTLRFSGSATGTTNLNLPSEWGGEKELYRFIHDIQAEGATLLEGGTAAERLLKHKPNALIALKYRVGPAAHGAPREKSGNDYRPVIADSYFHVLGNALLITPNSVAGRARFELRGLPARDSFASDLEHQEAGRGLTMDDLADSVLVGGDFRVLDAGGGARLAIRGEWARDDTQWLSSFSRIAQGMRSYWGDRVTPYLVTVLPIAPPVPGAVSIGGTGRADGFALFSTTNVDAATTDQVVAHEIMHTWIPERIGGLPVRNEALSYWLSEGFTDWASWRALVRSGVWQPVDFVKALNEVVGKYDASIVKNLANIEIPERLWQDAFVQKLPYQRGLLLAIRWDLQIRRATNGRRNFDDVLLRMRVLAANAKRKEVAVELLIQAMRDIANLDISQDVRRYVHTGETIPVDTDTFAPCATVHERVLPIFDRGFDIRATIAAGNVITGVASDSNAYRAGLRDGMKLVKRESGEIGNSGVEIRYSVVDGDTARTLAWMPAGSGTFVRREVAFAPGAVLENVVACNKRMGG